MSTIIRQMQQEDNKNTKDFIGVGLQEPTGSNLALFVYWFIFTVFFFLVLFYWLLVIAATQNEPKNRQIKPLKAWMKTLFGFSRMKWWANSKTGETLVFKFPIQNQDSVRTRWPEPHLFGHRVDEADVQVLLCSHSWNANQHSYSSPPLHTSAALRGKTSAPTVAVEQLQLVVDPVVGFLSTRLLKQR